MDEVSEIAGAITVAAARPTGDKPVGAKCFLVKKVSGLQMLVSVFDIAFFRECGGVDLQVGHQSSRFFAVWEGRLNRPGSAICKE